MNKKYQINSNDQYKYWNEKTVLPWLKYDLEMNHKFENITNILFKNTNIKKGEKILDIGCGSGFTSYYGAKRVGSEGKVLGVDISKPLLKINKKKYKKINNIKTLQIDIQDFKLKENSFDHVISRFGVMFFQYPILAFSNIFKSLKIGGDFTFVCWTNFKNNQFHSIPAYMIQKKTNIKIPNIDNSPGPFAFHEKKYLISILKKSSFKDFSIKNIKTTLKVNTLEIDVDIMMNIGTGARMLKENNASIELVKNIKDNLTNKLFKKIFSVSKVYSANIYLVQAFK